MKILVLSESYPTPEHPGRAVFLLSQTRALAARGLGVDVLFPRPFWPVVPSRWLEPRASHYSGHRWSPRPGDPPIVRRPYLYVPRHRGLRRRSLRRLLSLELARGSYDLVHAHWFGPAANAAVDVCRKRGLPVVITAHAGDVYREFAYRRAREHALVAARGATRIIAVASHLAVRLEGFPGVAGKVVVIPNGVDEDRFTPVSREQARRRLGWPLDRRVVLYAGQLQVGKGIPELLVAFDRLRTTRRSWPLLLVIAGIGPLRAELQARVRRDPSGPWLLLDWQEHGRLADLLNAADLFVLPSHAEGNPVTVLESLACGTPVVGTDIPALAEVIVEGRDGFLVPPRDPARLSEAMDRLLAQPLMREPIARAARERFGWRSVSDRIIEVYRQALAVARVESARRRSEA